MNAVSHLLDTEKLVDLHTHLEGSLPLEHAVRLAAERKEHPWCGKSVEDLAKTGTGSFERFLDAIRAMCSLLCDEDALRLTARELSILYGRDGVSYAEVYVSPFIYERWGLTWASSMAAVAEGLDQGESNGGAKIALLLDSVRQWGVEAATSVLDAYDEHRWHRVVGFGLGGEESVSLESFDRIYERARDLGLGTVVHAGETGDPGDVAVAVEVLGVDRIGHGIRAVEDREVLRIVVESKTPLDLAITSNYATGVVPEGSIHPVRKLVDAGATVSFGCDDPALFCTHPRKELKMAIEKGGLTPEEVLAIVRNTRSLRLGGDVAEEDE